MAVSEQGQSELSGSPFGVSSAEPSARDVVNEMVDAGLLDHLIEAPKV